MTPALCSYCDTIVDLDDLKTHTVNGRVGHPDNWLPDEHYLVCSNCGRAHDDFNELSIGELVEMIEDLKTALSLKTSSEIRALRERILELEAKQSMAKIGGC